MKEALHITILGAVQGVGFRPFVYRLAKAFRLNGWVMNSSQGVFIEVEGSKVLLEQFLLSLEREKPEIAAIHNLEYSFHDPKGYSSFQINPSEIKGKKTACILPDIATCSDCLEELLNPNNRRYQYPFINCTNCGPRFSIIKGLPYDRPNTTMKEFAMCNECSQEYENPEDRRFHAQPNACHRCGPKIALWDTRGDTIAGNSKIIEKAAKALKEGKILAFKGIGGFQLMVDSENERAVDLLRKRKHRFEKPFALMYPVLEMIKRDCKVSELEARLLQSPAAPIVLLEKKLKEGMDTGLAKNITFKNPNLGVMLPYTPLHHVLLRELGFPVVATSGNLSDEPICADEDEALERLNGIADIFLVHDRPIARHVDDSVVRVVAGREQVLRRARGYAPLPLHLPQEVKPMIAVGAHLKNTVAISTDKEIFTSQHIGDLETAEAYAAFKNVIKDFKDLYQITPEAVICDLHPEYLSTKHAHELNIKMIPVQHHYAHVLACMADNEIEGPVLGVSWDGTGLGTDNTIWGGEFLVCGNGTFERVGHLRSFKLPGGETAIRQPCRTALGMLYEIFGNEVFQQKELVPIAHFTQKELSLMEQMMLKNLNSPVTSSAGRLFDAVAAIIGLRQQIEYEGQAAMELEFAIQSKPEETYPFKIDPGLTAIIDWEPMILEIVEDVGKQVPAGIISAKFHNALTEIIVRMAERTGKLKVVLTGGCFQNKYLTERTVERLQAEGFHPYWHQRIPPNDGGISVGQLMAIYQGKRKVIPLQKIEAQGTSYTEP